MLFSSLTFLTVFLPIVIGMYFISKHRTYRNVVLMFASLFFYAWGEPVYIIWMLIVVSVDYFLVIEFAKLKLNGKIKQAKNLFITTLIINFAGLFVFKYFDFVISNINLLTHLNIPLTKIVMPIGISFYTFQVVSYVIDVYLAKVEVQKKWYLLMTYVSLFPQLIAGPIVRYETIENELMKRKENLSDFNEGFQRFIFGLGKKVIIANNVGMVSNFVFNQIPGQDLTFTMAWFGVIAFTFQIYFDFSGYSDMAIGLGQVFGFHFLENFNYPYIASSITDFWRRWHISLSSWFKDYIYIPMGGNRVKEIRWIINIFVVWGLTGFWHGANWNFIFWGLYYGLILVIEKLFLYKFLKHIPIIRNIYVILLVMIGWVLFNANDMTHVGQFITNMFDYQQGFDFTALKYSQYLFIWPYLILALLASTPLFKVIMNFIKKIKFASILVTLFSIVVLYYSLMYLVNDSYNPFIYFRF